MSYVESKPPKYLQHLVRLFWMYEEKGNISSEPKAFRIIADGCPGLIIQYSGKGSVYYNQSGDSIPESFLYGQSTKAVNNYSAGTINTFGVYFQPYAVPILFGFGADEITNTLVDLSFVNPSLRDQIIEAKSFKHRIDIVSEFIRRRININHYQGNMIQQVVNHMIETGGAKNVRDIYSGLHISERHFVRHFKRKVGITPKHFSRIMRFQTAMDALREKADSNYAEIAFDCGYADQSHFIKDFKTFTGFTPDQFHVQCREVIQNYPQLDFS